MAWYYGTYACGHEGRVNIVGKTSERQWKIDRHFSGICQDCRNKELEAENQKSMQKAKEYEFPDLKGTDKQVEWANTVRIEFYEYCIENKIVPDDIILKETDSRFWLDNRGTLKSEKFVNHYNKECEKKEINRQFINLDTVKPSEIQHDGVVEIVERGSRICCFYEKENGFIKLMREYHFKWNTEWNRELDETTGSYADRAAEIGNVLLKNGYCICIHDKTIMDNAITGNYIPEHKKWIYSRKDTSLLAINWGEKNDELYSRARKIKGSKWSSPSVVVDVSHYKAIEKFAEENDFRFTKNAIQKIENYKKQMENIKEVTV